MDALCQPAVGPWGWGLGPKPQGAEEGQTGGDAGHKKQAQSEETLALRSRPEGKQVAGDRV